MQSSKKVSNLRFYHWSEDPTRQRDWLNLVVKAQSNDHKWDIILQQAATHVTAISSGKYCFPSDPP